MKKLKKTVFATTAALGLLAILGAVTLAPQAHADQWYVVGADGTCTPIEDAPLTPPAHTPDDIIARVSGVTDVTASQPNPAPDKTRVLHMAGNAHPDVFFVTTTDGVARRWANSPNNCATLTRPVTGRTFRVRDHTGRLLQVSRKSCLAMIG